MLEATLYCPKDGTRMATHWHVGPYGTSQVFECPRCGFRWADTSDLEPVIVDDDVSEDRDNDSDEFDDDDGNGDETGLIDMRPVREGDGGVIPADIPF